MLCRYFFILACILTIVQQPLHAQKRPVNDGSIEVVFLQVNDVYEISPLDHGRSGGMARIATIRKELQEKNPLVYTVMAGDFISPSAIGTLLYDTVANKKIAGLQMIEAMNAAGVNLATFGNHEFDIKQPELTDALNRSKFDWVSSNVRMNDSLRRRFMIIRNGKTEPIPETKIVSFKDKDGTEVKIGIFGITIVTTGNRRYETYDDYYQSATNAVNQLKGKCDFIVALTHLDIGSDKRLAAMFPEVRFVLGGHEHINSYDEVSDKIISKADANAKTAYIHYFKYQTKSRSLAVKSRLLVINNAIEEDDTTRRIVDNWNARAHTLLQNQGFQPCEVLDSTREVLDGREAIIRTQISNMGTLVAESMQEALTWPADVAMYNSGSIRIDDILSGYITQYDIFRILPFENKIVVRQMKGYLIDSLLKTNSRRRNDGSFLQYSGVVRQDSSYYLNGKSLAGDSTLYRVALNGYLSSGLQAGLNFIGNLQPAPDLNPAISIPNNDMRKALIEKLRRKNAASGRTWPASNLKVPCY